MKNPLFFLFLSFKRLFKRSSFLLILLLFPAAAFFLSRTEQSSETGIRVAVCVVSSADSGIAAPGAALATPDAAGFSDSLARELVSHEGVVRFYLSADEQSLCRDVAARKADCGYLIPSGLGARITGKRYQGAVIVVTSPASSIMPVSNEILSSVIQEQYSGILLLSVLEEDPNLGAAALSPDKLRKAADKAYRANLSDGGAFSFDYEETAGTVITEEAADTAAAEETPDTAAAEEAAASSGPSAPGYLTSPVRGIVSALLFLSALTGVLTCLDDRQKRLFASVSPAARVFVMLSSIASPALTAAASGLLSLWLSGQCAGFIRESGLLLLYVLFLVPYCLLLMFLLRSRMLILCAIPLLVLASLVFSPVFIDLGSLSPVFSFLSKLFPATWYLKFSPCA